jgi:hypothetical protein
MVRYRKTRDNQTARKQAFLLLACPKHPSWSQTVWRSGSHMLCSGLKFETSWLSRMTNLSLQQTYTEHKILQDIGSGLNWKRPVFLTLLEQIYRGEIAEVIMLDKNRLCRFDFQLFEWIYKKHDTKIAVHSQVTNTEDTDELAEDPLDVVIFFVARNNGRRTARNRKQKKLNNTTGSCSHR